MPKKFDRGMNSPSHPEYKSEKWYLEAGKTSTAASKRASKKGNKKAANQAFSNAVSYKAKAGAKGRKAMTPWEGIAYETGRYNKIK